MINRNCRHIVTFLMLSAISAAASCRDPKQAEPLSLYSLSTKRPIAAAQALDAMQKSRLILVGEHHTEPGHHDAQLAVIKMLDEHAVPLSIGLEMFRKERQEALNRWISGEIDEDDFQEIYLDNWNFSWSLYRKIFIYAREKRIPMVGLNVSRGITQQVARQGFASLSDEQRGALEGVTCNVTHEYRDFIRSAFGAHGHGNMDFMHFCEAQLVWDTAMAINALNDLNQHPDRTMVLLAGSGHVRKMGIPFQVNSRSQIPLTVLLPHTPGIFEPDKITAADADFIIMP